jgi:hypothetical protein
MNREASAPEASATPWRFVGQDHEPGCEPHAGQWCTVLPIDGNAVFAGDRQEPLGDGRLIGTTAEARIRNNSQLLVYQRFQSEVAPETSQGRACHVVGAE